MARKLVYFLLLVGGIWAADHLTQMTLSVLADHDTMLGGRAYQSHLYEDAEDYARSAVWKARWLRPKDRRICNTLNNLALTYSYTGKTWDAISTFAESLSIGEKVLPADSPDLALVRANLGNLYVQQHRYAEAEPLLRAAISTYSHLPVGQREYYWQATAALGAFKRETGHPEEAEKELELALSIFEKDRGGMDREMPHLLCQLAELKSARGDQRATEALLRRAISIGEKTDGPDEAIIAEPLKALGDLYAKTGRAREAATALARAEKILREHPTSQAVQYAIGLRNKAEELRQQNDYEGAAKALLKAHAILLKEVGPEHSYVGRCLEELGVVYRDAGRYALAEQSFQSGLKIFDKPDGSGTEDAADVKADLVLLYFFEGRLEEAFQMASDAEPVYASEFGTESLEYSTLMNRRGLALSGLGRYGEAESDLRRALAIREKKLPPDHPYLVISLDNLAGVLESEGKRSEVAEIDQRIATIKRRQALGAALH